MMQPDPKTLLDIAGIDIPLMGLYDAPDTDPFKPVNKTKRCFFSYYEDWLKGESIYLTRESFGCPGAGYWMCGVQSRPREDFVQFLVEGEGLKASNELMNQWLDNTSSYKQLHSNIVMGPLREDQYEYLISVTFFVNPDQLGLLMLGATYFHGAGGVEPVISRFGSGCGQLATMFDDLDAPQAIIGATDIAMRQHLPPDILVFTVTKPMFEQLCRLDERSFLHKPFWQNLMKARSKQKY